MKIERLSLFNYKALKDMSFKSNEFNTRNTNVVKTLKELRFKDKILIKRNIYLLKDDKQYYGYLWLQHLYNDMYIVNDLFCTNKEFNLFENYFKDKTLLYDAMINSDCNKYLPGFDFKINDISDVLKLPLNLSINSHNSQYSYETFVKNKHEEIRCELQNDIFNSDSRIPITKEDIYFDEEQDYYIDEGLIFMKDEDKYIGMGQIINLKGKLTIVNFGIRNEYRNKGCAHLLLSRMIEKGKSLSLYLNKKCLYIRVSRKNEIAYSIYKNAGFQYDDSVITWER